MTRMVKLIENTMSYGKIEPDDYDIFYLPINPEEMAILKPYNDKVISCYADDYDEPTATHGVDASAVSLLNMLIGRPGAMLEMEGTIIQLPDDVELVEITINVYVYVATDNKMSTPMPKQILQ
jgi:hypothetical protein